MKAFERREPYIYIFFFSCSKLLFANQQSLPLCPCNKISAHIPTVEGLIEVNICFWENVTDIYFITCMSLKVIISAKKILFLPAFVCLFVCLSATLFKKL